MEDVEARFAHLLQPIRDLTKNWEVDVAAQLGEYLEELDQICISFDEGKTTMNFIEAALLIQGSACVYSKKVEYLYSLVYQALDFISGKKRAKQLSTVSEDEAAGSAGPGAPREVEDEFVSLDELPNDRVCVDMKNDQPCNVSMVIVPLMPMALVAPDEVEKNRHPLYSCQGEVLASRKDFRMNTCIAHPRGAFMLEPMGMCPEDTLVPRTEKDPGVVVEEPPMEVTMCGSPGSSPISSPEPGLSTSAPPEDPVPRGEEGDQAEEPEEAGVVADLPEATVPEVPAPISPQQSADQAQRYMLRARDQEEPLSQMTALDPWQSLDPFDSLDSKPFKKGRPFSVPPCIEEAPGQKRKRKRATKLQDFHQWYLSAYADHADSRRPRRKGPSFADMEALYWRHVKEQLEALRTLQRRKVGQQWLPQTKEGLWPEEEQQVEDSLEHLEAEDGFLESEDYLEPEMRPGEADDLDAETRPPTLSYEELVQKNVELFIATSQKFVQETELSQRIRDWEDTIQPLLQEQEKHVPFDIHTYGDQVVSRFSQLNEWCPFAQLVAGQPAFEVCRSMLASLQLANDYTVEITQQPGLEAAVDTMSLRLLTHQRAHKRFQTYTAPSMAQP
ncbi:PREDICTED: condensin-2 complex subunit H2 [Elephantulus edwardii]|uniref:condensin-2 complex subunit H2 n=1 Tax=Elephantulus edwardii TaxID=28737 RepID=UPI0003F0A74A|nr:PREDICTED: condensin-2 complex subunit H2 [Elephantulus edwardii]